jgi:hypothetical protein
MKVQATAHEPTKPGWYVVEWAEFPASPALLYYDERGWQRQPGVDSFFGVREGDVWWEPNQAHDFTMFLLRVLTSEVQ